jgi:uncharacterized protein (TIGR02246 family)
MRDFDPTALASRFAAHVNAKDLEGAIGLYEHSAIFVGPDGAQANGHEAIRRTLEAMIAAQPRITNVEPGSAVVADDLAMMSSRWRITFGAFPDAPAVDGSSTEVARRQADGSWLYAIDWPNAQGQALET